MDTTNEQPLDPRCREAHPERITIGGEVFIRNDVLARELGESERSLNRGDARGSPYRFFGGIKYRPQRLHAEFVMSTVQIRKPRTGHEGAHDGRSKSVAIGGRHKRRDRNR
jgi:hypothetical protein